MTDTHWQDTSHEHRQAFDTYYLWNPIVKKIWLQGRLDDIIAALDALNEDGSRGYIDRVFHRNILDGLSLQPGLRVLNVGCGYGLHELKFDRMYPKQLEMVGCDISETMIRTARRNQTPARLLICAAEALPFADNAFHRVLNREVIEHVIDPAAVLRELYRVCAPGGIAVVTTPNGSSLIQTAVNLTGWFSNADVQDKAYTLGQLERWIGETGFKTERVVLDGACYFMMIAWPRWLRWLTPLAARLARVAEALPIIRRLLCDQVKFVLRKPGTPATDLDVQPTSSPERFDERPRDRQLLEAIRRAEPPQGSRASQWVRGLIAALIVPVAVLVLALVLLPVSLVLLVLSCLTKRR
jgi:ubiquinone/menaquinone biosynthesis C-methylase UbiE